MAKKKREEPGIPEWVVTYGDMMSLLLCFFILLAAFSELKQEREYQDVVREIKEAFGYNSGAGRAPGDGIPTNTIENPLESLQKREDRRNEPRDDNNPNVPGDDERPETIMPGPRTVIGGAITFQPGSTELTDWAKQQLMNDIVPPIKGQRNIFEIRGHAWGVEDQARGIDLRTLSFRRAMAVINFMVTEGGVEEQILRPIAAGHHEPAALAAQNGQAAQNAQRTAENRRVEVYMTEVTVDEIHQDPDFTGRGPR